MVVCKSVSNGILDGIQLRQPYKSINLVKQLSFFSRLNKLSVPHGLNTSSIQTFTVPTPKSYTMG